MLGRGLILLAGAAAVYAAAMAVAGKRDDTLLTSARRAAVASFAATVGAAVVLWVALFSRDFSIEYVARQTTSVTSGLYTFSGLWSGMEGSLLLWCAMFAGFTAAYAGLRAGRAPATGRIVLAVMSAGSAFFLFMTALAANPFARGAIPPADGRGMNPLLYSWGMAVHPPLLYLGFTGTAVVFGLAVAGVWTRTAWVSAARRWALAAWLFLGAGLVVGGAWAYTELGWGGMWGWDPVENAALAPWLVLTAFLHSLQVEERRGLLRTWNAVLASAAFLFAVLGTFLTRSGSLYSVHAFAQSPVGWWFLVFLGIAAVGVGILIPLRSRDRRPPDRIATVASREGVFLLNNVLLLTAAVSLLVGSDLIPTVTQLSGGRRVVLGAPFFNRTINPILAALVLLSALGSALPWRRVSWSRVSRRVLVPVLIATVVAVGGGLWSGSVIFGVAVWIASGSLGFHVAEIVRDVAAPGSPGFAATFARNRRRYGGYVVHIGLAILLAGFAGSLLKVQREATMRAGDSTTIGGRTLTFVGIEQVELPDRQVVRADLRVGEGRGVSPQVHVHPNWERQPRSRVGVAPFWRGDVYVFLRRWEPDATASFAIHWNPLQGWVWLGALVSCVGGLVALGRDRRRNVSGAPPVEARPREAVA